ncbi:hypothetical protein Ae201684P_018544 [Aphanomyces euteiches]|uniref:RxLR effector protein n=1 Tax=Aphanomyces euteiches TaxID=100861 RepID=A0A6G0XVT8_9STRA|nr:hypothetical protein Ae201684_000719 [Aphanomyces euteiches]KAH9099531.1 hypothetical protein Ae201684P_018544 [Aphanomyces euteiches]
MRVVIALILAASAFMALNQRFNDSPTKLTHQTVSIHSSVKHLRILRRDELDDTRRLANLLTRCFGACSGASSSGAQSNQRTPNLQRVRNIQQNQSPVRAQGLPSHQSVRTPERVQSPRRESNPQRQGGASGSRPARHGEASGSPPAGQGEASGSRPRRHRRVDSDQHIIDALTKVGPR